MVQTICGWALALTFVFVILSIVINIVRWTFKGMLDPLKRRSGSQGNLDDVRHRLVKAEGRPKA